MPAQAAEFLQLLSKEENVAFSKRVLRSMPPAMLPSSWRSLCEESTTLVAGHSAHISQNHSGGALEVGLDGREEGGGLNSEASIGLVRFLLRVALENQPVTLTGYTPSLRQWVGGPLKGEGMESRAERGEIGREFAGGRQREMFDEYGRVLSVVEAQLQWAEELELTWFRELESFWKDMMVWGYNQPIDVLADDAAGRARLRRRLERVDARFTRWKKTAPKADSFSVAWVAYQKDTGVLLSTIGGRLQAEATPFPLRYLSLLYAVKSCDMTNYVVEPKDMCVALQRGLLAVAYAWLVLRRYRK